MQIVCFRSLDIGVLEKEKENADEGVLLCLCAFTSSIHRSRSRSHIVKLLTCALLQSMNCELSILNDGDAKYASKLHHIFHSPASSQWMHDLDRQWNLVGYSIYSPSLNK